MKTKSKTTKVLMYPGGKWRIAPQLVLLIPEHHTYLEPFFGSGAVFFQKEPSAIETINDLDNDVVNLFTCIREHPEDLAKCIDLTPYARSVYEQAWEEKIEEMDNIQRAANFLIRCWQSFNFRTSKKVGWKSDVAGRESMYTLKNWNNLPNTIFQVANRLKNVQIEHQDAITLIERYNYPNVFMYIDPPYLHETRLETNHHQYIYEMTKDDHIRLLNLLKNSKAKVMISGYDSPLYNQMLEGWQTSIFNGRAGSSGKRIEKVWMNYCPEKQLHFNFS